MSQISELKSERFSCRKGLKEQCFQYFMVYAYSTFLFEMAELSVVFKHSLHVLRWEKGLQAVVKDRRPVSEQICQLKKKERKKEYILKFWRANFNLLFVIFCGFIITLRVAERRGWRRAVRWETALHLCPVTPPLNLSLGQWCRQMGPGAEPKGNIQPWKNATSQSQSCSVIEYFVCFLKAKQGSSDLSRLHAYLKCVIAVSLNEIKLTSGNL